MRQPKEAEPEMSDDKSEIRIYAPDRSLQTKIGVTNLDPVLTPQVVESAQKTIQGTAGQFFEEGLSDLRQLQEVWEAAKKAPWNFKPVVVALLDTAFAIKSKAGLAGYDLVAVLAKSLQLYCEKLGIEPPSAKNVEIIQWHIDSMERLLTAKVKGMGGPAGEAIREEIKNLNPSLSSLL
jgi:hypothetical protein